MLDSASDSGRLNEVQWGFSTDAPVPGDLDGDRKTDLITWRPSTGYWYGLRSTHGYSSSDTGKLSVQWGANGDQPVS